MQKVLFWFQFCFALYRVCFRSQNVNSLEFYYQVKLYSFFAFKVWVFLHIQCPTSPRQTSQRMTQAPRALTSHGSLFHLITWMGFYWTITWYTAELINLKTTSPWLLWTAPFYTQNFQDYGNTSNIPFRLLDEQLPVWETFLSLCLFAPNKMVCFTLLALKYVIFI